MTRSAALYRLKALRLTACAWALAWATGCASSASPSDERPHSSSAPILNGYLDTDTRGVVALAAYVGPGQIEVFCSGSLIAPNLVLTARHCIAQIGDGSSEQVDCTSSQFTAEYDPRGVFVSTDAQPQTSTGQLYAVDRILEAPGKRDVCGYDVALLILSGAGVPSSAATPIVPELSASTQLDMKFSAVGYGLQRANDTQGVTAGSRMRFDGAYVYCVGANCPANAQNAADEWVGNSPVCSGDSGGPALGSSGRVLGVTSRGPADCSYALYSNVADWAAFIRGTANDAAAAGGYPAPAWATLPAKVPVADAGPSEPDAGTNPSDAGINASDAGAAGSPSSSSDAGITSAKPPPVGAGTPTVDPLGEACSGSCPGTYLCFASTGVPPGICVPACGKSGAACPADYSCSTSLQACVPTKDIKSNGSVSASCALSPARAPVGALGWATLASVLSCAWLGRRRRRFG